jgi:sensor histidine kinase regulating citrate/malate metabolism
MCCVLSFVSSNQPKKIVTALNRKIFLLAVLISLFAIGMTAMLVAFKINNTQRELRHSRFDLIARDINRVIEQSFSLGLSFNELTALPTSLARRKLADTDVNAIDVISRDGVVTYSTESTQVGQLMPAAWRASLRQQQLLITSGDKTNRAWRHTTRAESIAGTIIANSFGVEEGYVAVRYRETDASTIRMALLHAIAPMALATFVVTAILLLVLLAILMRRFERDTAYAAATFSRLHLGIPLRADSGWAQLLAPLAMRLATLRIALANWKKLP